ncbi:aldehyde dehydrogenase family protein [Williamsia sp. CHRR-6]|uniref:aldehyde dehydrogenase family protein n=1 Tax=Williamsia sp. CHRR-6 TaxID=2835871 RepID=UPI001BDAD0E0|nr:aldehyde dehydrogenase family protein [Williamsia sp. CHRR-6]MBT0568522.1 aldehyde dehydrogenase family protein [Williamsia sp. CHRR-6]
MAAPTLPPQSTDEAFPPSLMADLRRTYATGRTKTLEWRLGQLDALIRLFEEREADISAAIEADLGRAGFDAWLGDIASTKGEAVYARKNLKKWMRKQRASLPMTQLPGRAWMQFEPLGVVLVIGPWNYPVYLTLGPLVAAIAAGNCAVLKPSELAPVSSKLMADLVPRYLDADAIKVVEGDAAVTQGLLALGFDHAVFTGGTEVGRKVMAAAAPTLTPVTLELGGKSPTFVAADADLAVTARRIAWSKFLNSGQTCIAPDYIMVDSSIADALVDKIKSTIAEFRADKSESTTRIVNERQFARLNAYLSSTTGRVALGGGTDAASCGIEPTIVIDPAPDDALMQDEIFGPILPIITVDSPEAAIDFVNSRPKPLAFYVFTKSKSLAQRMIDAIPSGGAVVNNCAIHVLIPQLPFGGVGDSGMGAYHGKWGFEALSHRKSVLAKPTKPDLRLQYPPYSARDMKWLRRLF